jgi:hypothetical protein
MSRFPIENSPPVSPSEDFSPMMVQRSRRAISGGRQKDKIGGLCRVVFWLVLFALWAIQLSPASAADDIIFLKNGDRITGTIRSLESDQIEITTSYAGPIKIGVGEIQRVQLAMPLSVTVHEDVAVPEEVGERDGEHLMVNELSADGPLRLEDIKAIGVKTLYQRGNVNVGGNHTSGNSSTNAVNASATYLFRERWHRVQMNGSFNRGEASRQLAAENASSPCRTTISFHDDSFSPGNS